MATNAREWNAGELSGCRRPGPAAPVKVYVSNGVFSLTLPDTSLGNPANVCYNVTAQAGNRQIVGPGYSCVQPAANNSWCTNGACNFDNYSPSIPALALNDRAMTGLTGDVTAAGPGNAPATLAIVNPSWGSCGDGLHVCQIDTDGKGRVVGQVQVPITVTGGMTGPASSTANDISTFADTTGKVLQDSTVSLTSSTLQFPGAANINAGSANIVSFNAPSVTPQLLITPAIAQPTAPTGVASSTGGTIGANNYYEAALSCVDPSGRYTTASVASGYVATTTSTSEITWSYTIPTGCGTAYLWLSDGSGFRNYSIVTGTSFTQTSMGSTYTPASNYPVNGVLPLFSDPLQFSGAANIVAGGTNQDVNLVPSGTGVVYAQNMLASNYEIELYGTWLTQTGGIDLSQTENFAPDGSRSQIDWQTNNTFALKVGIGTTSPALQLQTTKAAGFGMNTVTFSATPVFDASLGNTQEITLTGNVTSFTITNAVAGETLKFIWIQNATGTWTVSGAPANLYGFTAPATTANKATIQSCAYDGTNWYCEPANSGI